jgi:hypothetical protein
MKFFAAVVQWSDEEDSYYRTFWAHASHMGEALDKILKSADANDIPNPIVGSINFDTVDNLPETATTDDDGDTYADDTVFSAPLEHYYQLPYGVIESFTDEGYTTEDLTVGYDIDVGYEEDDDDLIKLRALVNEDDLLTTYLALVDGLPNISGFWIKLQDDWEEADSEEIYKNTDLNSRQRITEFIDRNRKDILLNGHVTITANSSVGKTNLNISDHKMIEVLTYDLEIAGKMAELLKARGVYQQYELLGVDQDFDHWHYRHPQPRDRQGLVELLKSAGFELWDPE